MQAKLLFPSPFLCRALVYSPFQFWNKCGLRSQDYVVELLTPQRAVAQNKNKYVFTSFAFRLSFAGKLIYKLRFQNMFEKFRYTISVISCWDIRVHFTPIKKVGGTKG